MKYLPFLFCFFIHIAFSQGMNPDTHRNGIRLLNVAEQESTDSLLVLGNDGVVRWAEMFSRDQIDRIKDLVYAPYTSSFSKSPSYGERGVVTNYNLVYNIISNDDQISSASINQGIGDVTADIDQGSTSSSQLSSTNNITYTLTITYDRNGTVSNDTYNTTFYTYVPQWTGYSSTAIIGDDYTAIESESNFNKYVQSSNSITRTDYSPTNQYIWFISTDSNLVIKDGNGFPQTISALNVEDGASEFYKKSLTLTLSDGTTTATVYTYRTRNTKSFTNLTYSGE